MTERDCKHHVYWNGNDTGQRWSLYCPHQRTVYRFYTWQKAMDSLKLCPEVLRWRRESKAVNRAMVYGAGTASRTTIETAQS